MEWQAPAIVLDARPLGEGGAVVTLLTGPHGRTAGLARGGASRAQASVWQPGNLIEARWIARLPDQLGTVSAELVHPAASLAMAEPLALALLASCCAVAAGALPEREPHLRAFHGLLGVIARLPGGALPVLPEAIRWEMTLLAELGYGLDLSCCAATGSTAALVWVSPRTGRAVSADVGAPWADRLLALPAFLSADAPATTADLAAGLRLTAHFLARDAFGAQHRPLPPARVSLQDRVAALAGA